MIPWTLFKAYAKPYACARSLCASLRGELLVLAYAALTRTRFEASGETYSNDTFVCPAMEFCAAEIAPIIHESECSPVFVLTRGASASGDLRAPAWTSRDSSRREELKSPLLVALRPESSWSSVIPSVMLRGGMSSDVVVVVVVWIVVVDEVQLGCINSPPLC